MDMKYYIGILCAVTLVIGSLVGTYVSAEDNADINEITKTIDMETLVEQMEAKGFIVTVQGDQISAYKEGDGKTMTITFDCPDSECQWPEKPEGTEKCGMDKKHYKFRMHGTVDMEDIEAKMLAMGYDMGDIEAKMAYMENMEHKGFEGCPMRAMMKHKGTE